MIHVTPTDRSTQSDVPPRLLLVFGSETARRNIGDVVRRAGWLVDEALDRADGLTQASTIGRYAALVVDLDMPNNDGLHFRETQLRDAALAKVPTIVISREPLHERERYVLRARYVIQKPVHPDALTRTLRRISAVEVRPTVSERPSAAEPDKLFWSCRGEVACGLHAPADDDRWQAEQWAAIPDHAPRHGIVYQCEHCPGNESPIRHGGQVTRASHRYSSRR